MPNLSQLVAVVLAYSLTGCGSGSPSDPSPPPSPTTPPAAATVAPSPSPTSAPTAIPTEGPRRNAPGPVEFVHIKVHAIRMPDGNYRTPRDEDGDWVIRAGETVAIDATPKNERGQACDYDDDEPQWTIDDYTSGLRTLRTPNPFVYWLELPSAGLVDVWATVDGKRSNPLRLAVR